MISKITMRLFATILVLSSFMIVNVQSQEIGFEKELDIYYNIDSTIKLDSLSNYDLMQMRHYNEVLEYKLYDNSEPTLVVKKQKVQYFKNTLQVHQRR